MATSPALEFHGYFWKSINDFDGIVATARERLADVDFDTIVGMGLSGATVIPPLARALGKKWLIVRKKGDSSHTFIPVVGDLGHKWLFVDDFISSGETFRKCVDGVTAAAKFDFDDWHVECVGTYQYQRIDWPGGGLKLFTAEDYGSSLVEAVLESKAKAVRAFLDSEAKEGELVGSAA